MGTHAALGAESAKGSREVLDGNSCQRSPYPPPDSSELLTLHDPEFEFLAQAKSDTSAGFLMAHYLLFYTAMPTGI